MIDRPRLILGIDPGFGLLGYGIIQLADGQQCYVTHGCFHTSSDQPVPMRLRTLYADLVALRAVHAVTDVAMESLFYWRNVTTAIGVGQARGVAMLATVDETVTFREYTPTEVKQSIAGFGQARKRQIQQAVSLMLGLAELPRPDDAADALAIALCHSRHVLLDELLEEARQHRSTVP